MALVVEKTFFPDFLFSRSKKLLGNFKTFSRTQDSVQTLSLILYQVESPRCGPILALSLKLELNLYSESN